MAELVDAHGSGPCAARCGGSSPLLGTTPILNQPRKSVIYGVFSFAHLYMLDARIHKDIAFSNETLRQIKALRMTLGGQHHRIVAAAVSLPNQGLQQRCAHALPTVGLAHC